jgi:DNA-binding winged helix-turn-helix (wHTH) protein
MSDLTRAAVDRTFAHFGQFTLDPDVREVRRQGKPLHLTPKAFDLLTVLVSESPRVVTKAELHERLWAGTFVSDATLVGVVKELRRVLVDRDPAAPIIRTAHGVGYAMALPVTREPARSVAVSHWLDVDTHRVQLVEGENLIGRDPDARVWLNIGSVSRRHAQVIVGPHGAVLHDLGSKNRTTVGDTVLTDPIELRDGDRILIGGRVLVYHASRSGLPTDTLPGT